MANLSQYDQYRPPGRSNRSGRSNNDNDVFEGLPVKQWGQSATRVSLAPPVVEVPQDEDNKWGEPPMPRDYQLLQPYTQQLLRLARSGKYGTKRKQDPDSQDEDKPDEETADESKHHTDDRGYVTRKWKPVPESMLEPEHKHFEFLAKRRKGLSGMYGPEQQNGAIVPMRKTKVQKVGVSGEVTVYEVLIPEGQVVEGEIADAVDVKPVLAAPGTVIEGVGIANEDGVVVAEHLKPSAPRRNRPPPKKKGGPGRGKKRVTFTNPDGSTYTTIVPNATKIVPQPGQTVKHVAKGEEATADITAEEAAAAAAAVVHPHEDGEEGSGSDEGDEDGDDEDDDREEGELSDDDAPTEGVTPAPALPEQDEKPPPPDPMEDVQPILPATVVEISQPDEMPAVTTEVPPPPMSAAPGLAIAAISTLTEVKPETPDIEMSDLPDSKIDEPESALREPSSSPDTPLVRNSHSRTGSLADLPLAPAETAPTEITKPIDVTMVEEAIVPDAEEAKLDAVAETSKAPDAATTIDSEPIEPTEPEPLLDSATTPEIPLAPVSAPMPASEPIPAPVENVEESAAPLETNVEETVTADPVTTVSQETPLEASTSALPEALDVPSAELPAAPSATTPTEASIPALAEVVAEAPPEASAEEAVEPAETAVEADDDLLGSLEKHLETDANEPSA